MANLCSSLTITNRSFRCALLCLLNQLPDSFHQHLEMQSASVSFIFIHTPVRLLHYHNSHLSLLPHSRLTLIRSKTVTYKTVNDVCYNTDVMATRIEMFGDLHFVDSRVDQLSFAQLCNISLQKHITMKFVRKFMEAKAS